MKTTFITALALVIGLLIPVSNAAITSVLGPNSSLGTAPAIISPPTDMLNSFVFNTGQQSFDEAKVVTTSEYTTDSGAILAGTLVSSHMIFLNAQDPPKGPGIISHTGVTWTFSQPILGVMSDSLGNYEATSTPELGAPGTNYTVGPDPQVAPYPARGMEGDDFYLVSENEITVNMTVTQPGDWICVVTCAQGSQGFWKNYPGDWPLNPIVIGGVVYSQEEAVAIMEMPTKGDKTLTMFPQVVAAKLNANTDACPFVCIVDVIAAADAWMAANLPGSNVKANSDDWKYAEPLYEALDAYNNEELTCDD